MEAIRTQGLCKKYKDKTAVRSLDLSIEKGEFFGLLGVNGAGKTTTIKMLTCLARPTFGTAQVMGHDIVTEPYEVKKIISVSPQETAVAPNLTVRENLELMAGIYGFKDKKERATKIMEELSLGNEWKSRAKTLSGGIQRRLSLAMALISEPQILFLDEPTVGLDVIARRELWEHIVKLKGSMTIILTTHYMEEVEALCSRMAVMNSGELMAVGTAEELVAKSGEKNFENAFVKLASGISGKERVK